MTVDDQDQRTEPATAVDPSLSDTDRSLGAEVRRVALSSFFGNTIEFYDFLLYSSAAALIFGRLFFSNLSPALGTIASFATFATGYVARPLGGIFFGHLGDRIGRKSTLITTMLLMGISSGLIGALPTRAQAGALAPVLLVVLRLAQGFAVGGEWGGATLMAAEHAPAGKRGRYTGISQMGLPLGGLLSTLVFVGVTKLPEQQLFSWGWRVPFLVSFVLLGVGLYLRVRISESPLFAKLTERSAERRTPIVEAFRRHWPNIARGVALCFPAVMVTSLFGSFAVSYAAANGWSRPTVLAALSTAWGVSVICTGVYARLSDRLGRRPVYLAGAIGLALVIYPAFLVINHHVTWALFLVLPLVLSVTTCGMSATFGALLSEMFGTETRYTSVSVAYQAGSVLAGFTPVVAGALLAAAGGGTHSTLIVVTAVVATVLAASVVITLPESRGSSLERVSPGTKEYTR